MSYRCAEMRKLNIKSAMELRAMKNGQKATVAGAVITRQRPGTAKGLIFLTLEDESTHANVIVMPDIYAKYRQAVLEPRFVRVFGTVQNQDGIVHLRAESIAPLTVSRADIPSHDFY
jgi:error-prone DNA polymerase